MPELFTSFLFWQKYTSYDISKKLHVTLFVPVYVNTSNDLHISCFKHQPKHWLSYCNVSVSFGILNKVLSTVMRLNVSSSANRYLNTIRNWIRSKETFKPLNIFGNKHKTIISFFCSKYKWMSCRRSTIDVLLLPYLIWLFPPVLMKISSRYNYIKAWMIFTGSSQFKWFSSARHKNRASNLGLRYFTIS